MTPPGAPSPPAPSDDLPAAAARARGDLDRLREAIATVVVGQEEVVERCLIALLAGGHVLLEGVPGLGKTQLVKALAAALECSFSRIQFTPDMLPMDITGTHILVDTADGRREFDFRQGPIFANVVLADEINRATPKTQAALLEAMQEGAVTVARDTWRLPDPFFVLATQNPIEMEGTYPLPEAQLDRFLFKVLVPFPDADALGRILDRTTSGATPTTDVVLDAERVLAIRALGLQVEAAPPLRDLVVQLVMATHPARAQAPDEVRRFVRHGASPRGGQALLVGARFLALLRGRLHVSEADVRDLVAPCLRHRILLNFEGESEGVTPDDVLGAVARSVRLDRLVA